MEKRENGFVPIILIVAGVTVVLSIGMVVFMFLGNSSKSGDQETQPSANSSEATTYSSEAQKVLNEGVDFRRLNCPETDLTGCDSTFEGDNPQFID